MQGNQFINQSTARAQAFMRDILDAAIAGAVNTSVVRFNPANDNVIGEGIAIVHDANLGDSIVLTRSGIYLAEFGFSQDASDAGVKLGISQNVAAAALTIAPVMTSGGMLALGGANDLAASAVDPWNTITTPIYVTAAGAEAVGGQVIRAMGTQADGTVLLAAEILNNTDCFFRVTRIGNLIE